MVAQALVLSNVDTNQRFADIRKSTYGICFFGTPHRGADVAVWGKFLVNISRAAFKHPKTQLLDTLRSQSHELLELALDFGDLVPQLQIVSCVEQKETSIRKWGVEWKRVMVSCITRYSAQRCLCGNCLHSCAGLGMD